MRSFLFGLFFFLTILPAVSQTTGDSIAEFGFDYFLRVAKNENTVVSPLSIHAAFSMLALGVSGAAESETLQVLRLDKDFAAGYRSLLGGLEAGQGKLSLASKVWLNHGLKLQESYLKNCAQVFNAAPETLDFGKPEAARKVINQWVSDRTESLIPELLPAGSIQSGTELVLSNALYFEAAWANGFRSEVTREGPFHGLKRTIQTPFMRGKVKGLFYESPGLKAVSLPYKDCPIAMLFVLPEGDLASIRDKLNKNLLADVEKVSMTKGVTSFNLSLPKFKVRQQSQPLPVLSAMGMKELLEKNPDFSKLAKNPEGLAVSDCFHEAVVEVDENGTKAAAATAIVMTRSAVTQDRSLTIDRPFYFVLYQRSTLAPLFVGQVVDPSASQ